MSAKYAGNPALLRSAAAGADAPGLRAGQRRPGRHGGNAGIVCAAGSGTLRRAGPGRRGSGTAADEQSLSLIHI